MCGVPSLGFRITVLLVIWIPLLVLAAILLRRHGKKALFGRELAAASVFSVIWALLVTAVSVLLSPAC